MARGTLRWAGFEDAAPSVWRWPFLTSHRALSGTRGTGTHTFGAPRRSTRLINQREAALADYTRAIDLHPQESFLYVRRGRHLETMRDCSRASADFAQPVRRRPKWAEPYNLSAGVYANCPDPAYRDPEKSLAFIQRAIALDAGHHPAYLTVLALAYFRPGQFDRAASSQQKALASPGFPPGYRDEAIAQLGQYRKSVAGRK